MSIFNRIQFIFAPAHRKYVVVFLGIFLIAISFALYTNHVGNTYYITYRSAKNLATGHGLVFTPGERVYTFTSPLNVLIPAILSIVTGNSSDNLVLWLYRVLCSAALGITAALLLKIARKSSLGSLPTVLLIGMFGMEAKIIGFSVNGQGTAFMMLFLVLTLYALIVSSSSTGGLLGVAWAGLMWTRPDSFVYIGGLALGFLMFHKSLPIAKSRKDLLKIFLRAGIVTMVLYLPWFIWVWSYYGSPIPHAFIAEKMNISAFQLNTLIDILFFPFFALSEHSLLHIAFLPAYTVLEEVPDILFVYSKYLAWICAFYWCLPFGRAQTRAVSFASMLGYLYLTYFTSFAYSGYIPGCTLLGVVVFSHIVQQSLEGVQALNGKLITEKKNRQMTSLIRILVEVILVVNLLLTLGVAYQSRIQHQLIEEGHRKQIGLWLRQHAASSNDTVFLESSGYIGYFSQLKIFDFPGEVSPEVVAARKKLNEDNWAALISELQPDWLVLRPYEIEKIDKKNHLLLTQDYARVKIFDVSEQVQSYFLLPGRGLLMDDQTFIIFQRNQNRSGS